MLVFLLLVCVASCAHSRSVGEFGAPNNFIVGGSNITINEAPYQIAMLHRGKYLSCGGFILDEIHIGTAAHCVSKYVGSMSIRAGSKYYADGGVLVGISKGVKHPLYGGIENGYDAAVLTLKTPLNFSDTIKPIQLGDTEPPANEIVRVTGWGTTRFEGVVSETLLAVDVPIVDRKTCIKAYDFLTKQMICAGVEGKDSCQGDSGGPLTYKGKVVGIVSFGHKCAEKGYPGVYTNIADPEILKFLKEQISK